MTTSVTHFEIYGEDPAKLAEFYRTLLGWQIDKAPGIDYWRIDTGAGEGKGIGGGLLFRPIPGLGRPETPIRGLYLASASAHPGGGVHGACGANAARVAIAHDRVRRLFSPSRSRASR
jgi:predicted enzyme related to lactoylglutathione lyase